MREFDGKNPLEPKRLQNPVPSFPDTPKFPFNRPIIRIVGGERPQRRDRIEQIRTTSSGTPPEDRGQRPPEREEPKTVFPGVEKHQDAPQINPEASRIDIAELQGLLERKLVTATHHPTAPLTIYNYSDKAMHRKNLITPLVEKCRGLIISDSGEIVARPFPRIHDLRPQDELPPGGFQVYDKVDGSLGIQYWHNGKPQIATRRSFEDRHGRIAKANAMVQGYSEQYQFDHDKTYLWEIVDPENQEVVKYQKKDLVLLGIVETATGRDLPLPDPSEVPFSVVQNIPELQTLDQIRTAVENRPNTEGFVIRMDNTGKRFRIKSQAYHWNYDIKKGSAPLKIWQHFLKGGSNEELLENIPDEVHKQVSEIMTELRTQHKKVRRKINDPENSEYPEIRSRMQRRDKDTPRERALRNRLIWEAIKPHDPRQQTDDESSS